MKYNTKIWTALLLYKRRDYLSFPVYQRGDIWTDKQKSLLIDSMLRGIDVPKFYLQRTSEGWDVIDGQQRIRAVVGFFNEEVTDDDGRNFEELGETEKATIENYPFTITEVEDITEEEIRLLFVRLQLGTPINSGEMLNAIKSKLGDFVKVMLETPFIKQLSIPIRRFAKEQVCAQICNNSLFLNRTGEYRDSKYEDLENLYRSYSNFDFESPEAKGIMRVLAKLYEIFSESTPDIRNRAGAVTIYLFVEKLDMAGRLSGNENVVKKFYLEFLENLRKQTRLGIDATNRFLINYQNRVMQSADSKASIRDRANKLEEAFNYYLEHGEIIGFGDQRH
jgi:hypothetical protein